MGAGRAWDVRATSSARAQRTGARTGWRGARARARASAARSDGRGAPAALDDILVPILQSGLPGALNLHVSGGWRLRSLHGTGVMNSGGSHLVLSCRKGPHVKARSGNAHRSSASICARACCGAAVVTHGSDVATPAQTPLDWQLAANHGSFMVTDARGICVSCIMAARGGAMAWPPVRGVARQPRDPRPPHPARTTPWELLSDPIGDTDDLAAGSRRPRAHGQQ